MNAEFRKFLEQMDEEEKRKNGPLQLGHDYGAFFQVKTDTEVKTYQVNQDKLLRWAATHPDLGVDSDRARLVDVRPEK